MMDHKRQQRRAILLDAMKQIDGHAQLLQSYAHVLLTLDQQEGDKSESSLDNVAKVIVIDLSTHGFRMTEIIRLLASAIRSISSISIAAIVQEMDKDSQEKPQMKKH
jgi:hypothetical protein